MRWRRIFCSSLTTSSGNTGFCWVFTELIVVHSCESDGSEEVEVKHARTGAAKKRRRKVVQEEESEEEEEEEEFACKKCGMSTFFRVSHIIRHGCSNISPIQQSPTNT